jgi:heptosyltransferase-1
VIRLGAVGDVVRTLPAASRLRSAYPRASLHWLVEPAASSALLCQPWIDEVIVFPRAELAAALRSASLFDAIRQLARFVVALRRRRFDLVVDFHSILRSGVLSRASGAPLRVAYARPFGRELSYLFANHWARLRPERTSRFDRNNALLDYLAVDSGPAPIPWRVDATALLRVQAQLGPGPAPIAIHAGTSDATPHKRYPISGYAAVARDLAEKDGIPSIVTCGPAREDRSIARAIVEQAAGAARLAPVTHTLEDLAVLFAACRLYLGADTGPMHVASLVGTPVVQLIGPTDPIENAPWPRTPSRSVSFPLLCSPCRRGCAAATCMRLISPVAVVAAARELLGPGLAGARGDAARGHA